MMAIKGTKLNSMITTHKSVAFIFGLAWVVIFFMSVGQLLMWFSAQQLNLFYQWLWSSVSVSCLVTGIVSRYLILDKRDYPTWFIVALTFILTLIMQLISHFSYLKIYLIGVENFQMLLVSNLLTYYITLISLLLILLLSVCCKALLRLYSMRQQSKVNPSAQYSVYVSFIFMMLGLHFFQSLELMTGLCLQLTENISKVLLLKPLLVALVAGIQGAVILYFYQKYLILTQRLLWLGLASWGVLLLMNEVLYLSFKLIIPYSGGVWLALIGFYLIVAMIPFVFCWLTIRYSSESCDLSF